MVIFLKKLRKLPSDWGLCPQTPVNTTLELHQFVQHAAQLQHFLSRIILTLGSKPLSKIFVAAVRIYLIRSILDTSLATTLEKILLALLVEPSFKIYNVPQAQAHTFKKRLRTQSRKTKSQIGQNPELFCGLRLTTHPH